MTDTELLDWLDQPERTWMVMFSGRMRCWQSHFGGPWVAAVGLSSYAVPPRVSLRQKIREAIEYERIAMAMPPPSPETPDSIRNGKLRRLQSLQDEIKELVATL